MASYGRSYEVMNNSEKYGGRALLSRTLFLNEFIQKVGALDLGCTGNRFTWENRQKGKAFIKERLDRFLANRNWLVAFKNATVEHLISEVSNHVPIMLNTARRDFKIGRRPIHFIEAWTSNASSLDVVNEAWGTHVRGGMESHRVRRRLNATAKALRIWNRTHFGYAHERILVLERELESLQFG